MQSIIVYKNTGCLQLSHYSNLNFKQKGNQNHCYMDWLYQAIKYMLSSCSVGRPKKTLTQTFSTFPTILTTAWCNGDAVSLNYLELVCKYLTWRVMDDWLCVSCKTGPGLQNTEVLSSNVRHHDLRLPHNRICQSFCALLQNMLHSLSRDLFQPLHSFTQLAWQNEFRINISKPINKKNKNNVEQTNE